MSMLIQNIPMPTLYTTYKIRFVENTDGKIVCGMCPINSTAFVPVGEAIEIPPHGRLIDADKMAEEIWNIMSFPSNLANAQFFVNTLREAPTVIPAEEV